MSPCDTDIIVCQRIPCIYVPYIRYLYLHTLYWNLVRGYFKIHIQIFPIFIHRQPECSISLSRQHDGASLHTIPDHTRTTGTFMTPCAYRNSFPFLRSLYSCLQVYFRAAGPLHNKRFVQRYFLISHKSF